MVLHWHYKSHYNATLPLTLLSIFREPPHVGVGLSQLEAVYCVNGILVVTFKILKNKGVRCIVGIFESKGLARKIFRNKDLGAVVAGRGRPALHQLLQLEKGAEMVRAPFLRSRSIISIPTYPHRQVLPLYFLRQFIDLAGKSAEWGLDKNFGRGENPMHGENSPSAFLRRIRTWGSFDSAGTSLREIPARLRMTGLEGLLACSAQDDSLEEAAWTAGAAVPTQTWTNEDARPFTSGRVPCRCC
jgi:hypothetical protein